MFMVYLRKGMVGKHMHRILSPLASIVALTAGIAAPIGAQGATSVSGQVAIAERPGETTEDLGNVVVFLESMNSAARKGSTAPTNTDIALDKRQFSPRVRIVTEGS